MTAFAIFLAIVFALANVYSARTCFDTYRENKHRWFLFTGILNIVATGVCIYLGYAAITY